MLCTIRPEIEILMQYLNTIISNWPLYNLLYLSFSTPNDLLCGDVGKKWTFINLMHSLFDELYS